MPMKSEQSGEENRSLVFALSEGPKPYDFTISVSGSVTGAKYGSLLMTENDGKQLFDLLFVRFMRPQEKP